MELNVKRTILHTILILHLAISIPVMSFPNPKSFYLYIPAGILWLQGESDASFTQEIAESYRENLINLVKSMRDALDRPELPVVVSQISESHLGDNGKVLKWGEIVQDAQKEFAESDRNSAIVYPSADHGWLDPWHYDSKTYLELGVRFADAIYRMQHK
jgi:hypothetical protein